MTLVPRLVAAAAVERDAADQVDGPHQLVVGHGVLRRLVGIGRGRRRRGRLVGVGLVGVGLVRIGLGLRGLVVGLLGARIGRLGIRVEDRAAQVLLAEARTLLDRLDLGLLDLDVGLDAFLLDRAARWREVERRGQADRAAAGHLHDGLHRTLTERAGAEDDGTAMVLQSAGHDLRGRGRAAVHQHHDRQAAGDVARLGVPALHVLRLARLDRDDLALVEEGVDHGNRLVEQAARVVAQVEDVALELGPGLLLDLLDRVGHARGRLLGERGDADVADVALEAEAGRLHLDGLAGQGDVERILHVGAAQRDLDRGADLAAHLVDGLLQGHSLHRLAVQREDQVARLDAGLGGGRIVDRRHHLDDAVLHRDFDAEPAELAPGLDLHVLVDLGVHVAGVRVERREHALDGILHQRLLVDRLDIVAPHPLQHVAEQVELLVEFALVGRRLVLGLVLGQHGGQGHAGAEGQNRGGGSETETSHWIAFAVRTRARLATALRGFLGVKRENNRRSLAGSRRGGRGRITITRWPRRRPAWAPAGRPAGYFATTGNGRSSRPAG